MKLCKDCGINQRYASPSGRGDSYCVECRNRRNKEYQKANRESMAEFHKKYREANRDAILEKKKEYYKANRESILEKNKEYKEANRKAIRERDKEYQKEYYKANKDSIVEKKKRYREANKEAIREYRKEYRKQNPDVYRRGNNRRRAKKQENGFERYSEQQVLDLYGTSCHICSLQIDLDAPRKAGAPGWENGLHIDHVMPISRGGGDTLDNVRPSHGRCNVRKHNKID